MQIRRRDLLAGSVPLLSACSQVKAPLELPLISIIRASNYSDDLAGKIRRALLEHKVTVQGARILLKPNLVEFDENTTINTHPAVVYGAFEAFRSLGAADVKVAEGPGHRRCTIEMAEAAGYFDYFRGFENLFTDLNVDDVVKTPLVRPVSALRTLYLPKTPFGFDLVVSMPKMKTHHWVGATLSMKNLFGLVPGSVYGWPKNILHWSGIDECVADIYRLLPRRFAVVDGIVGMEGNGPIQGKPKQAGVMVLGHDLPAVDATCCRVMGIDPWKVRYLKMAASNRLMEAAARQIGEPLRSVQTAFELIPEFREFRLRPM